MKLQKLPNAKDIKNIEYLRYFRAEFKVRIIAESLKFKA
nr:MAG TPA: hypothetical protein [Caudoviricetes sp.]